MKRIKLLDKKFELKISSDEIQSAVMRMALRMNKDLKGKETLFICILNGAFVFASDLLRELDLPDAEISFMKISSYAGVNSKGVLKELIGLKENITGRNVVILEDIVDSGLTMGKVKYQLMKKGAATVKTASLLFKPGALIVDMTIDYTGIDIENDFVVGYGLDYCGKGRNLKDIYTLVK